MLDSYLKPIFIQKYNIYDIFHNDINQLVIITPKNDTSPLEIYLKTKKEKIEFVIQTDGRHNHTVIYYCNEQIYNMTVTLIINGENIDCSVNKYPSFKDEIIMSTEVKNEDKYIVQWIEYHLHFGITRFIIYDNKNSSDTEKKVRERTNDNCVSDLSTLLHKYIKNNIVILIDWRYELFTKYSRTGQTTQQNHSIYAFRNSKYIGLIDIDEYINSQIPEINLDKIFSKIMINNNLSRESFGGFTLRQKPFYNPNNKCVNNYNFLKIYDCDHMANGGRKVFVIPTNIGSFSVHVIACGKRVIQISPNILYFNHYLYLNKKDRGINVTNIQDNSIKRIVDLLDINPKV